MTMESWEYGAPMEELESSRQDGLLDTQNPDGEAGTAEGAASEETPPAPEPEGDPPEVAPKKKRTSKKKVEQAEEAAVLEGGTESASPDVPDSGEPPALGDAPLDGEPPEAGLPDSDTGAGGLEDCVVVGLAVQDEAGPPGEQQREDAPVEDPPPGQPPADERRAAPRPRSGRAAEGHSPLLSLKLNELDRDLTGEERQEWNDIYASFRSKSVLAGTIIGVDAHTFHVRNRETGQTERKKMYCAAVIAHRVKVLIPETEMWMPGEERPSHVLRNMTGAEIGYVILDVDREGGMAIASRRMALMLRRRAFDAARGGHAPGERLACRVLAVGPSRCLLECGGRDVTLRYQDMSYASYSDLRQKYRPGEALDCVLKGLDRASGRLDISVKEAAPNPFEGAVRRHPLGCRRQAVISGKYGGGVFCTMPDGATCLCLYTAQHADRDFRQGDTVILVIVKYDFERSLIYGHILSKW